MDGMKKFFKEQAEILFPEVWELAREIGENPELGYQEFFAVDVLTRFLSRYGFEVVRPIAGLETAFLARFRGKKPGPRIAFLAEYDALPEVGHGCGHNLIGAASAGAGVVLSRSEELLGEVLVIGTPAEETSGAKVTLVEKGIFDRVDAAMMFHPGSQNVPEVSSLALDALEFTFMGRSAHAVAAAQFGVNALEAMITFFNNVNALKKEIPDDTRINGIITEGGTTPNIVPDKAVARFYLRAPRRKSLDELQKKVIHCAKEAASSVSAKVTWRKFENSYDDMLTNRTLAGVFTKNLRELGIKRISSPQVAMGSVDMGNVSRVVPAIHPYLALGKGMNIPHTRDYTEAVLSPAGEKLLLLAIESLVGTGWDILNDPKLLKHIKKEFYQETDLWG